MLKALALTGLTAVLSGCAARAPAWKGKVEWPTEDTARLVGQPMEAGAAFAAAGAVREMVRTNPYPDLFHGCTSPEQGLDVVVFAGPTPGLYYVVLHQRFNRCGGPAVRVLDGWYSYAVTPQGEVVAEAPPPSAEDTAEAAPANTAPSPVEPAPQPTPEEPAPSQPSPSEGPPAPATPPAQPAPAPGP
jgi:hypothetical protein